MLLRKLLVKENNKPLFGAPVFHYKNKVVKHRVIIEYKKDAKATLNYSTELKKIIFDHLIPLNPAYKELRYSHVPDGSYEGFKYKLGRWVYIEKVFKKTFEEAPVSNPR